YHQGLAQVAIFEEAPDAHTLFWLGALLLTLFPAVFGYVVYYGGQGFIKSPFRWSDPVAKRTYCLVLLVWLCWDAAYLLFFTLSFRPPFEDLLVSVIVRMFGGVNPPRNSLAGYYWFQFIVFSFRALPASLAGLWISDRIVAVYDWLNKPK